VLSDKVSVLAIIALILINGVVAYVDGPSVSSAKRSLG
jgi:hypothetical protein